MEPKKSSSPEEDKIDSMRLRSKLYVHIRCRSIVCVRERERKRGELCLADFLSLFRTRFTEISYRFKAMLLLTTMRSEQSIQ